MVFAAMSALPVTDYVPGQPGDRFDPYVRLIRSLLPRFEALAEELVDAFAADGRCEFMSQFATPYAARVTAILITPAI